MMAGSASGREQLEKRSVEVLCPADASVPGSFAFDEIVEKLSRVNRGGSISDLPADMSHIQIQDFGRFSKLIWGDDRPAPIRCSSCGAVDFQASSHAILKSPSLAFLHSVWRTKTMLDKKDSCLPRISKLFDTTSDYKHIRKMLGEDRACADSSSDHVAARVERPEASYISGSQFFQVGKVNVQSWACVSFSCLSLKEIITVLSELRELMAPGMDISPEPTLFIHATTYSHHTDIKQGLLSARKFFCKQSNVEAKLLVILHDAEYSDGYLDELCKGIEVYQSFRCSPKPHKGDLKNVASEIMLKVLDFRARKSSVDGSSELEEFGELFRGEDTDGSYNNKNDIGAEEISEDKPSEKQQLHVEKSSTKKRKHADCDELHRAELIRDEEPQDANKDSSRSLELIWNDFIITPSIQCTCGFHFRAPPSSAFLLSVWRTEAETKLLDKKDSCLPMIDHLKLFDTTGDYKFIGKMPAEDRACPDSSSDHAAAHAESRNSTADNSSEGRKRPEASHVGGSQVRVMSKESFAKGFATINYDNLEVRKLYVRSWACVSFSHNRSVEEIFTGLSELTELMATEMDISLEPSLFINATYPDCTDMGQAMLSVREFFCEQSKTEAKLLVILRNAEYSNGTFDEFCEEFGVTYQYCCSQRLNKKYLMDVASEIMFKVLNFIALNSSVDRWDELMEEHASRLESYKKLFGDEDTDGSHNNKIDIGNEEISEGKPSEKQQLHVEKSFSKKRKHADCEDLQEVEPMDEEPPVANKVKEGSVKKWACVCFAPLSDFRIQNFSGKLRDICVSIGMDFVWLPLLFVKKKPACSKDIEDCLWDAYEEFVDDYDFQCKLDLLTVILPQDRDFHGKVEEVCTHMGVVCQYFWPISAILPKNEYLRKAAQEIRHKVVGRGQPFVRNAIPFLSEHTVVFGADISPEKRGISLFSVVASMNWPEVSRYKHLVRCKQQIWSEVVDDELVRELLHEFYQETMKRPERVIFFRHEVRSLSDRTYDDEIAAVRESCASIYEGLSPKITYVVVSINEGRNEMTNKSKNIHPGAEAGEVGHAVKFEFDVEHTVEGTAHYRVILDNNFTLDELNSICLDLCTPHHRWAYGDMPMVAPAYFASHGDTVARRSVLSTGREEAWDYFY